VSDLEERQPDSIRVALVMAIERRNFSMRGSEVKDIRVRIL
jgi:hypothetical protein